MRITQLLTRQHRLDDMLSSEERLTASQERVSSGKRVERPSDAPQQIGELLQIKAQRARLTQIQADTNASLPLMKSAEASLGNIATSLSTIRTLAIQANGVAGSDEQRQVIADQIRQLAGRIQSLGNTRVGDRYLFGGVKSDTQPFADGPPVSYAGGTTAMQVNVAPNTPFDVAATGDHLMNQRSAGGGATDLFRNLSDVEAAVRAGDSGAISAGTGELDKDLQNVNRQRADAGARLQYVQLAQQRIASTLDDTDAQRSSIEDADLAASILDVQSSELTHQAALSMAARFDKTSLLDYLR